MGLRDLGFGGLVFWGFSVSGLRVLRFRILELWALGGWVY